MARLLLIDDDDQIRAFLRQMLEREGYEVMTASDGKEGIRLYREQPADLVITDIIMPEKEGIETIRELKRDFQDVKIITISGGGKLAPELYLNLSKQLGALRTITKPFDRKKLLVEIRQILKKRGKKPCQEF